MDSKWDLLHDDVKEIKANVIELVKQGAVHNEILARHEQRSTQLEERFQPVEHIYIFAAKLAASIGILAGVAACLRITLELLPIIQPLWLRVWDRLLRFL